MRALSTGRNLLKYRVNPPKVSNLRENSGFRASGQSERPARPPLVADTTNSSPYVCGPRRFIPYRNGEFVIPTGSMLTATGSLAGDRSIRL
jgi:hypothetical protein